MLAEKFFLVLETLRSHAADDGSEIVTANRKPPTVPEVASASERKKPEPGERD